MEGTVSVERDSAALESVDTGTEVQNFDLVQTGPDGQVQIGIGTERVPRMTVTVDPDTRLTLELSLISGRQQTAIGLVGGSVALKVAKLSASQDVLVKTDSASMGVRGTSFTITAPASGDVLVTCDEGDVQVTDDQGRQSHAVPGTVVEKRSADALRSAAVAAAGLAAYRASWRRDRDDALQKNALKLIVANAALYQRLTTELASARTDLSRYRAIVTKWTDEHRQGRIGQREEVIRERAAIAGVLVRLRRVEFQLERVAWRLRALKAVHDRGIGVGTIDGKVTTAQFFARIESERSTVREGLALTRFLSKMYARRNDGALP